MCGLAFAWRASAKWPLVLIGNRDEAHDRASAPLDRWADDPRVLGGLDLVSGGSWLGVSEAGRLAVVTNVRSPALPSPDAPSRGLLVRDVLTGDGPYADPSQADLAPFNPMNLITVADGQARFWTNRPAVRRQDLTAGIYGLSNGGLDDDWPKTRRLKGSLKAWLAAPHGGVEPLLAALADETRADDGELPATGLATDLERQVSPIFIRRPVYGTRCSSVVRIAADGQGEFVERRFDAAGQVSGETRLTFRFPRLPQD